MSSGSTSVRTDIEFKKIAEQIFVDFGEVQKNIHDLKIKTSIVDVSTAFAQYEEAVKKVGAEIAPTKQAPELRDFENLFKDFDDFSPIKPKPKKTQKDSVRLNSASTKTASPACISANASVDCEDPCVKSLTTYKDLNTLINSSNTALTKRETYTFFDELQLLNDISLSSSDGSHPKNIFESFETFQKKLKRLQVELKNDEANADYLNKLQQLQEFSKKLEQLSHMEPSQNALTVIEKSTLLDFLEALDNLDYIQQNDNLVQYATETVLDDCLITLDELLTYALKLITK